MKRIKTEKLPVLLWGDDIEPGALRQIQNLAVFPYAYKHIAIMPDCHEGYGMPIGGVLATNKVVIPNAVGVDIGCGMCAIRTDLANIDNATLAQLQQSIRTTIPLGFSHHKRRQDENLMPKGFDIDKMPVVRREYEPALYQIGTLGGGNHFIELQKGSDGYIWLMIHSGSRNIGKQVADHYNQLAVRLNEKQKSAVPRSQQLAYLFLDTQEGKTYIQEMTFCVDFAFANRKLLASHICSLLNETTGCNFLPYEGQEVINIAHNYAATEQHYGHQVMVHRKGATRAAAGQTGIIPGSQGHKSYIVKGKGSKLSFESCAHGAGRKMGRNEARKRLNLKEEQQQLESAGIVHALRTHTDLDEAAGAYKDISRVMEQQSDLVEIAIELQPLMVVKG